MTTGLLIAIIYKIALGCVAGVALWCLMVAGLCLLGYKWTQDKWFMEQAAGHALFGLCLIEMGKFLWQQAT